MASFVVGSGQSIRRIFFFFMLFSFSIWFTAPPNEQLLQTADGHFGFGPKQWQRESNLKWTVYHINITQKSATAAWVERKKKTQQDFDWLLGQCITTNSNCLRFSTMAITEARTWRPLEINVGPFHDKNPLTFAVILMEVIIESIMS